MTDTIPNVPRELLADLLGNDHDKRIMAERHLLAMLANSPSPAGVDGLDGVSERIAKVWIGHAHIDDLITIGKEVDAAQAIIDGLRAQVAERDAAIEEWSGTAVQNGMQCDQQAQRIGELEGLLLEVRGYYKAMPVGMGGRIDAALSAGKEGE